VLLIAITALSCAASAGAASAYEYGEVLRFGGFDSKAYAGGNYEHEPTPEKFLDPTGFAVDPVDNTVYVVDRTSTWETNPTMWRIQQFKSNGELEGTTTFTLPNISNFTDLETDAVAGLAVDHEAGRLYALMIGSPPTTSPHPGTPVAQELLAWSTTPEDGKLVAASEHEPKAPGEPKEFSEDPLKTGGALISDSSQLELKGGIPLYGPEGIAIDRLETPGVDNPVVIEASDYNTETGRGTPVIGDTIVQQVATQRQGAVQVGDLLTSWSGAGVATTLGGVSWGPHGIFDNPDGTISVLLDSNGTFASDTNVVRLEPNLSGATVLNSDADAPADNDYDEAALSGDAEGPFNALAGVGISNIYGAGPDVAQLSSVAGNADGPYVADIFAKEQTDIQFSPQSPGPEYWTEGEPEHHVKPNIGIRLLQPEADGAIATPRGGTIVNTLGNNQPGGSCNIGASEATLAAGADGTLWVLARGPESLGLSASKAVPGREIIELAPRAELPPGDEKLCPQPSGTFTMSAPGGPSESSEGPPLEVPAGTQVAFGAGSIMVNSESIETGKTGKPFAYEWDLEGAAGGPFTAQKIEQMKPPYYYFPSPTIKHMYTRPGRYAVTVRLLSDYGAYTTASGTVVVTSNPIGPHPQFTAAPAGDQQIAFDGAGSTPGVGTIVHYTWNWGDGSPPEGEEAQMPAVTHTYASPGVYQVTLTVTNSAYQSATSAPQTVIVEATPPPASVLSGPLYAIPPAPLYEIPGTPPGKRSFDLAAHARFAGGAIKVKLSCPKGAGACAGAVEAQTASRFAIAAAGKANKRKGHTAKPRRLSLGRTAFHLAAGRQTTVTVHISAQGLALLKKLRRLTVLVSVTARNGAGEQGAQTLRLGLSAPASVARAHSHKRH
jgi:hypothetical protein